MLNHYSLSFTFISTLHHFNWQRICIRCFSRCFDPSLTLKSALNARLIRLLNARYNDAQVQRRPPPHQTQLMMFAGRRLVKDHSLSRPTTSPPGHQGSGQRQLQHTANLTWPDYVSEGLHSQSPPESLTVPISLRFLLWFCSFWGASLQFFQLLHKQRQVLQQIPVLEQQLMDPGLSLHTSSSLCCHLILQQLYLWREQRARCVWASAGLI